MQDQDKKSRLAELQAKGSDLTPEEKEELNTLEQAEGEDAGASEK